LHVRDSAARWRGRSLGTTYSDIRPGGSSSSGSGGAAAGSIALLGCTARRRGEALQSATGQRAAVHAVAAEGLQLRAERNDCHQRPYSMGGPLLGPE
jgi:hypothetical protein